MTQRAYLMSRYKHLKDEYEKYNRYRIMGKHFPFCVDKLEEIKSDLVELNKEIKAERDSRAYSARQEIEFNLKNREYELLHA